MRCFGIIEGVDILITLIALLGGFSGIGGGPFYGELGHTVVGIAVSADEALQMAREKRPDIILMNIRLVGARDGIAAARETRSQFGNQSL
ncbi:hypothetical protein [Bradyrhizobium jicamae]|uniref:hypothetical protein n=1 Tax=Bradyrhizobium jicamae TaxID=280332 RepID=UPI001BA7227C|nr:hypothetical protein [Bradyrhizobium jicamae]MBR0933451.1 hypothetical protein [Bradyrhizobium jicamae]